MKWLPENIYTWRIFYRAYDPGQEPLREAISTLGNGYIGTRGSAPECDAIGVHYPGTYIAGLYNRLKTKIAGKTIVNEDFVNCPNWAFLTFKIGEEEWFSPTASKIISYYQELDMKGAILNRRLLTQNWKGQKTIVNNYKIVSMDNAHILAMKYTIIPQDYNDEITIRAVLDGRVRNTGVARYRQLNSQHWRNGKVKNYTKEKLTSLSMTTSQSKVTLHQASRVRLYANGRQINPKRKVFTINDSVIGEEFKIAGHSKKPITIEKIVAIYTSKDKVKNPFKTALTTISKAPRFDSLAKKNKKTWSNIWNKIDIQIKGNTFSQKMLRLHMFHLMQTGSPHTENLDVGLPARGLHGEAYRGHIFWDGIYTMPFYDFHLPEISKSVLTYRCRRLKEARKLAKEADYKGAMFPWQSGSTGREETQIIHLNPLSGKWGPDYSHRQRHISFAIAYNVWNYFKRTGDIEFLKTCGAELFLSIAHFCGSLARYSTKDGRFHIDGVMGPDEFHEKYPWSSKPGLKDNAYSNFMVVWILDRAKNICSILPRGHCQALVKKLGITSADIKRWDKIRRKMNIVINDKGIISQFDGYFKLKELDWQYYREKYKNIQRLDRILKAEGKDPDAYKISKQADVLMIFYLFSLRQIKTVFNQLGYKFNKKRIKDNYEYYIKRTSHGSTLSKVAHCFVAHKLGKREGAWDLFQDVLESDFYDTQGGTTPEGIHMGVMGGSVEIVLGSFAGLRIGQGVIHIEPDLPDGWKNLNLKFCFKGNWIDLTVTRKSLTAILFRKAAKKPYIKIKIYDKFYNLKLNKPRKVSVIHR